MPQELKPVFSATLDFLVVGNLKPWMPLMCNCFQGDRAAFHLKILRFGGQAPAEESP
jgi:hypothetical protein